MVRFALKPSLPSYSVRLHKRPRKKNLNCHCADHFDLDQYEPPPFRIFAGLHLAEVASATQAGNSSPPQVAKTVRTNSSILHHSFPSHYENRKFLNCHGSFVSTSSANVFSRSVSGVQSVYLPTICPIYGSIISITRSKSISSASTTPLFGFSIAQIIAPNTPAVT